MNKNSSGGGKRPVANNNRSIVQGKKKLKNSIEIANFNDENLIFDTLVKTEKTDKSNKKITFWTSALWYGISDSSVNEVQIELPRLYCYGVSAFDDAERGINYNCAFVLGDRDGPNELTDLIKPKLDKLGDRYMNFLVQNREELNLYKEEDLTRKKLQYTPPYKQRTDRGINIGAPILKTKLWQSSYDENGNVLPQPKIYTVFYDGLSIEKNGEYRVMTLEELLNPEQNGRSIPFYARATIVFRSAFVGTTVCNFKVILKEAVVFRTRQTYQRLLAKPKAEDIAFANQIRQDERGAEDGAPAPAMPLGSALPPPDEDGEEEEEEQEEEDA
jgi:hypothetical protein